MFIFIYQAGSNINNNNIRNLNYKHLIKYYNLLQNWHKPFTVEISSSSSSLSSFYLNQATWPIHKHTKIHTDRQTDRISKKYNKTQ